MASDTVVATGIAIVAGYLIGSIPIAGWVARRRAGTDLRDVGDRNPGYWNAKEQFGRRAALPVFVGDTAKGAVAALIGVLLVGGDPWGVGYAAAAAAMLGHAYPVFARFRGGRSVLCFAGAVCVLSPLTTLLAVALLLLTMRVVFWSARSTKATGFAWGARIAVFGFPLLQLLVDGPNRTAATGGLMCLIGLRFVLAARAAAVRAADTPGPATTADA